MSVLFLIPWFITSQLLVHNCSFFFTISALLYKRRSVKCFGKNYHGQFGKGSNVNSNVPVAVNLDAGDILLSIAAGYEHTYISILKDKTMKCFGWNGTGLLLGCRIKSTFEPESQFVIGFGI